MARIANSPVQRKQGIQVLSGRLQSQRCKRKRLFFKDVAAANRKLAELAKRQKKEGQDGLDIPLELTVMAAKADQRLAPFNKNDGTVIDVKILVEHDLVEAFVGERAALTHRCYNAAEYELGIVVQDSNAEYGEIIFTK